VADVIALIDQYSHGTAISTVARPNRGAGRLELGTARRETLQRLHLARDAVIGTLSAEPRSGSRWPGTGAPPDVLLLDEPTNHLDLDSIEWLENLLIDFKAAW